MKIPRPSNADRDRFASFVPVADEVEVKPMFGNLGAFVRGNMFMGLFGADVGVKLPPADCERLLAEAGAGPFGPEERPMSGYVTLPADWSAHTARPWIAAAYATAATLPPKKAKPRASKKKRA